MDDDQVLKLVYVAAAVFLVSVAVLAFALVAALDTASARGTENTICAHALGARCPVQVTAHASNELYDLAVRASLTLEQDVEYVDACYQRDPLYDLWDFMANDTGDQKQYTINEYTCMDFSIDLAHNLTDAGYDAGILLQTSKSGRGHMMVWVAMPEPCGLVYIEPIYDNVYDPADYRNGTGNEDYIFREVSIDTAERNRAEQRKQHRYMQ